VSPFLPSLAWTTTLPFYASHNTGVTSACHHAFLTNVLVWLAWNRYPPNLGLLCSLGWQAHANTLSYWLRWGLANFLPGSASNHDPPDLSLPSI
jgi:hypothetical protein